MDTKLMRRLEPVYGVIAAMGAKATRQPDYPVAVAHVDEVGNVRSAARMAQGRARPQRLAIRKASSATRWGQETLADAERLPSQGRTVAEMGTQNWWQCKGSALHGCVVHTVRWHGRMVQLDRESLRSRPGTLRVVGSLPGKTRSLVRSLSRQGLRRGRWVAKQACLTKTWHGRLVEILSRLYTIEIPWVRCILGHAMMSLPLT